MRIAIVNDMALAREVLRRVVQSVPGGEVAWVAADGEEAVRLAAEDRPDVILMDLVMPRVDGAEATRRIMRQSPCPILIVTATVTGHFELVYQAMGAGGLDAVETPTFGPNGSMLNVQPIIDRLRKIETTDKSVSSASRFFPAVASSSEAIKDAGFPLVAIGASTGGPTALAQVLGGLPTPFPAGVIVAQHIAKEFGAGLAEWLGARCHLPVASASDGTAPTQGRVIVAVTNDHLVMNSDGKLRYTLEPREVHYRPSIDALFRSLAPTWPSRGVAVLLTGMGMDGAKGLLKLRNAGWHTIAQDESTSVVYGMPKAAAEMHAAIEVLPLEAIAPAIVAAVYRAKRG